MAALTHAQLDSLTTQLKDRYRILLADVSEALDNAGSQHRIDLLNHEPGDFGDESLATALADITLTTLDHHVRELRDIDAAFQRIKQGSYGECVECGEAIALNRLRAYPTAKRCLVCQEKREREYARDAPSTL